MTINFKYASMKLITSNLLAEKPYRKYGKVTLLDFEARKNKFALMLLEERADILLLQEVDEQWKAYIAELVLSLDLELVTAPCWSSGLAVLLHQQRLELVRNQYQSMDAGILALQLLHRLSGQLITVANIHAPWGSAQKHEHHYKSCIPDTGYFLAAGDFNTNGKEVNANEEFLFGSIFPAARGFCDITAGLPFTSRNVNTNDSESIDYVVTRGLAAGRMYTLPDSINHLLPHNAGAVYDPLDINNHYSDHAAIVCELDLA